MTTPQDGQGDLFQAVPSRSGGMKECVQCHGPFEPYKRAVATQRACCPKCRRAHWKEDQLDKERKARDKGMGLSAAKNEEYLRQCRSAAQWLGRHGANVSIEDVREWIESRLANRGHEIVWGAWTGSVFKGKEWVRVGYTQARHEGSHARTVGVWRLRQG